MLSHFAGGGPSRSTSACPRAQPRNLGGVPLRYLTIDFNSFFASVEQQERPELRGKPVGIVPVMAETTGCVAISIEAKATGSASGIG